MTPAGSDSFEDLGDLPASPLWHSPWSEKTDEPKRRAFCLRSERAAAPQKLSAGLREAGRAEALRSVPIGLDGLNRVHGIVVTCEASCPYSTLVQPLFEVRLTPT
jgi:hypothetical protein